MNSKSQAKITALGAYLPSKKLTNHDLEGMVNTSDEWIVRRTGVQERRIANRDEFASDLAIQAVTNLIEEQQVNIADVDMVIVTTFTPDHLTPTVSALVQGHFGIKHAGTMDINAACTGFVYGLCVADSLISAGHSNKVLVIAAEVISKVVDYSDRNTCVLFGDAAVAALVERTYGKGSFIASSFASDGSLAGYASCSNLSAKIHGKELGKERTFQQEGKLLYEYVVKHIPDSVKGLVTKAGLTLTGVDWFVPHSANLRMIQAICERLDFPLDRTLISNEFYGNTSSASIPLGMWAALQQGRIKNGNIMVLYGFGAGLTYGGIVFEWQ
ncbi:3-oxoacyl-[acyl-carrier-protein] synthase 3 protein 2 [Propionispora sp. 2/2-37]|uniref:ketoacyl-ACP synthase III n=1 Tax=Propionispora sp. 2/2-37 TaxID=1677858 RepID=UPI0006BB8217|nr:ketoacyl-ACP synthase III [Propionispora sp. 2/2-37]CUH96842.1 3-oxoacyl-[acyl-carrier-protein] synthase 3 protein 2 [Propionispora sp. 2/2-37]